MAGWDWVDANWRLVEPGTPVVPSLPRYYVPRPRLHRLLDHALDDAKVTHLRAPAVSGKSTLLSGWHAAASASAEVAAAPAGTGAEANGAGTGPAMAYVSLDRLDNDPVRFWSRVLDELHLRRGADDGRPVDVSSYTDARELLMACLPELARRERSVLVLDRVDVVTNDDVCRVLGEFLLDLPSSLRVVLSGRAEPAPELRTGLLRARGQVAEIHARDLAFDRDEMAAFFAHFAELDLSYDHIDALYERTEGWIGGVTLAGLALMRHVDKGAYVHHLTGSSRYVAELLAAEVFDPQPPEVRDFMLATSVLDVMDGPLADAVTGGSAGAATLDRLERSGTFVEAVDEQRTAFRYRSLFREFLRHKLGLLDPEREMSAQLAAARQFEGRGEIGLAVAHYVGAEEAEEAIRLVLAHGERVAASGDVDELRTWLAALPDKALTGDVRQMLGICRLCVMVGMRDEAALWLERSRWRLEGSDNRSLVAFQALLSGYANASYGNFEGARADGQRTLVLATGDSDAATELRLRAHHLLVAVYAGLDQLDEARKHRNASPPDAVGDLSTHAYGAWLSYREGRLDHALSYADELLAISRQPWQDTMPLVTRGAVHRERNQLAEADADLVAGVELCRHWSRAAIEIVGSIELALLRFAQRREAEAFTILTEARPRAHGAYVLQRVGLAEAALWLRAGDLERSLFVREELPDGKLTAELDVRLALQVGPVDEVAALLSQYEAGAQSLAERIRAHLLRARLALAWDDVALAEEHLHTAIEWGRREQFVQTFAEDLPVLEPVLRGLVSGYDDAYPFGLLAAIAERDPVAVSTPKLSAEHEPLSDREQIVLRYLPTGLSNKRIAAELHMSVNTLKTHLKSIYRKLGARSRGESVAHARELHLL